MLCICALFVPSFVEGGRPFHIPRTLFSPALENAHLPQFAREIRAAENEIFQQDEDANSEEDASTHYKRKRRDASGDPILPKTSYINLNVSSRTLYMYWTPSSVLKNNILLLVKSPKGNSVYQSTNFGQNWKNINDKLKINSTTYALIDHIYISQADPHFCILTDVTNNVLFITTNMQAFKLKQVSWVPSQIHPHPRESNYVLGHDKHAKTLFFSNNKGRSWTNVGKSNVRFFEWGIEGVDKDHSTFYVESLRSDGATTSEVTKFSQSLARSTRLLTNILEFDIRNNFLFATVQVQPGQIKLKVSHNGKAFVDAQFPNYETGLRDFFVYEVEDDKVFVVINHKKNASHMYLSDYGGVKYYLSIERVLYHNPWTDVSSPWLRSVVPYAFVDVHKIKSVKGTYIATQLTRGRVGRRHLLNLITYNKGGTWQRIRAPTRDVNGNRIYCFLPSCSLHFNLKYGSVYHVSPSEETMSKASVPGLVMALGVASTNLKIYPDFYLSTDGGLNWKRVKRGKFQFAVGNHGSVIVAVPYRRQSNQLHYSIDGGDSWKTVSFHHRTIYTMDVATQSGEKLLKFLIYGHVPGSTKWVVFYVDMEPILRKTCNPASDYIQWTPSDTRIGDSRCTLGRQITYQIRNWTIPCKVPSQFTRSTTISNCPCTRSDFMCDFGFSRKSFEQDCSLLSEEDMNKDGIVPANCPEGTFYNRTRGYRKIPFDTCEGGYESDFLPVSTPCPVQNLEGLTVTNSKLKNSAVHVGDSVNFTAALKKGYIANIMFRWDFGYDNKVTNGTGKKYATMKHTYSRAGHFVLMVTAHNTKSTLIKRLDVFVQVGLENRNITIKYTPSNPAINELVSFIASVNDNSVNKGQLTYKWDFGQGSFQAGAAALTKTFTQARTYIVKVQISNRISTVTKQISVTVAEVLEGLVVQAQKSSGQKVFVAFNTSVLFTATLAKGSVENVNFTWDFGDGQGAKQAGKGLSAVHNTYSSAGLYTVKVTAKNSKTSLFYLLNVAVQMRLESSKLRIFYDPPDPSSKQPVSFTAAIQDDNTNAMGSLTYKWNFGDGSPPNTTTTPTHSFSQARRYNVTVEVANKVSKATISFIITVTEDLTPRNPKVSSRTARTVTLIWDHPVAHDRFIDGYRIFKSTQENSGFSQAATVSSSRVLSQNIPNLMPYTKYYFKVASYSEGTMGTFSKVITATTLEDVPSKPMNFRAYPKTSTSIQLQWERPKYPNGKLTNYWVVYWSGTERRNVKRYQPTIMQATVSNLKEDSTYNFEITAETAEGKGSKAGPLVVKTNVSAPTMPPRNVRKIGGNTTCILLQWDAPYMARDDKRLFPVEKYIVYANSKEILTTSQTFADVCSLKPDRQYVFAVKAKSVKGTGPPSEKKNFRTAKPNPTAPAEFNVNVLSSRSVEFSWKEPKVTYGGVENYIIEQVEPTPNKGPYEVPANKYEFKLTELTPYTTYKFEIGAKSKKSGRVSWSEVTEVQTPEDVPDTLTKTDIETRVEVPTSSTIKLIWRVPRPNGILTGYKIRWGHVSDQHHVGSHEINVENPNVKEYVFKHLHANTEYSFSVRPRTKMGESDAFSEPVLQFTGPAMNMTERVSVVFEHLDIGTISRRSQDDHPLEQFVSTFIKAAAKAANLATEERIAGVDVKGKRVEFDLLPPLKEGDVSTKDAKASLNKGFQVGKAKAIKGSLVVVHVYIEKNGIQGTVVPVKAAAQSGYSSVSKNTLALAIVIPIVIIGIALLVGLVFYYRKYKNLETRYGRVTGGLSGNQMDSVVYNGGMSNDTTDEIYIDGSKKRRYKDDEKMPLGEHDELAMI